MKSSEAYMLPSGRRAGQALWCGEALLRKCPLQTTELKREKEVALSSEPATSFFCLKVMFFVPVYDGFVNLADTDNRAGYCDENC